MSQTAEQFLEYLNASGLVPADELSRWQEEHFSSDRDVEAMAQDLIRQKLLTEYQATAIYQGNYQYLRFGDYVVLEKIGAGGMGVALKAEHQRMRREVAVKVLPAHTMRDEEAVQRFYREVEAAAQLTHPNIVHAYDAGEHDGLHFLVMEYVAGRDLSTILRQGWNRTDT